MASCAKDAQTCSMCLSCALYLNDFISANGVRSPLQVQMEISSSELVSEAKSRMLSTLGLEGGPDGWRLVKTNWAEELMGGVEREDVSLKKCGVGTGDLLVRNPCFPPWLAVAVPCL